MKTLPTNQTGPATAELFVYGTIGSDLFEDGITAKQVADSLEQLPATVCTIVVRINSAGGYAHEATAIYNLLKRDPREVRVSIDGLAASAASVLAMAGDRITAAENALLMVHRSQLLTIGNVTDHRKSIEVLTKLDGILVDIYAGRTGGSRAKWERYIDEETWFTADEALDVGLVDEVVEGAATATACVDKRAASTWRKLPPAAERFVIDHREVEEIRDRVRRNQVAARMKRVREDDRRFRHIGR